MLPHLLLVKGAVMGDDIPPFLPAPLGAWAKHGLCVNADDPDVFYPPDGSRGTKARRICARCPVRAECLEYALDADEEFGIWGGLDPRERRNLKRKRARRRAAEQERRSGGAA